MNTLWSFERSNFIIQTNIKTSIVNGIMEKQAIYALDRHVIATTENLVREMASRLPKVVFSSSNSVNCKSFRSIVTAGF